MKNKVRAAILLAVMLGPASAWAGSITEAQLRVVPGGHASYGTKTGHGIVSGYGIGINELVSSSETLNILMGRLTFVTGKATGSNGNSFLFGPGGKFTVRGCVDVGGHSERWCHKND